MNPYASQVATIRLDTVVCHLQRFDADGVEVPLPPLDWKPRGAGRAAVFADGVDVEIDTQKAKADIRVTLGPDRLWRLGADEDPIAEAERLLQTPRITESPLFRYDIAADIICDRATLEESTEGRELYAFRDWCEGQRRWFVPFGFQRGGCKEVVLGKMSAGIQIVAYDKPHPYHWPNLGRYTAAWEAGGWPGIACRCGAVELLGDYCPLCGTQAKPWGILRAEIRTPRKYSKTVERFDKLRRHIADAGSKGRKAMTADLRPRWRAGILEYSAAWDEVPRRPIQARKAPSVAGIVEHYENKAAAAERRANQIVRTAGADALAAELAQRRARERREKKASDALAVAPRRR